MNNLLVETYIKTFHEKPSRYFMAPCRINLIGEHTDYNGGLALPAAISKFIHAAVGKRNDRKIYLKSLNKLDVICVDLDNLSNKPEQKWGNYPLGIFASLIKNGHELPFGLNIIYSSYVPIASGLSSSAALLDLTAFIASKMYGIPMKNEEIAMLAHQSESEFNGLQCGVMDEFAIALGKRNKCILLDCSDNSFSYEDISFKDLSLVVIVSNVRRNLVFSPYNTRVAECKEGLERIKKHYQISSLSDIKVTDLPEVRRIVGDETLFKRIRHVVTENQRVRDFVKASKDGNTSMMCKLLNESHDSLKNDYEVTGEYLDFIHDISLKSGALAERMTGAGFGGSSIALVPQEEFESFKESVFREYYKKYRIKPLIFLAEICDGLIEKKL